MDTPQGEETIFGAALRLPVDECAGYVARSTVGNPELRVRLEALLANSAAANFLDQAAASELRKTLICLPLTEKPGDTIGRYKLLQQIGEGGCGVVYMAEQTEPVRRRVALKIIKLGMDTKSVIARFEAERQALAMMDHSNIAKVLDAGATDTGRPYFVMELVRVAAVGNSGSATHLYAAPGVYTVTISVEDDDEGAVQTRFEYVVIYDPNGGFVTGGGWINSPTGAFTANSSLTGRATFGFVSKYKNGTTVPSGETEFQLKTGDLNFQSTSYQWLVVAGAKAQYKGSGTINGAGNYTFLITATDGQGAGGGGVDKFRIKITNAGGVVYDNVVGGSDDLDAANPQVLGGGSIVMHK